MAYHHHQNGKVGNNFCRTASSRPSSSSVPVVVFFVLSAVIMSMTMLATPLHVVSAFVPLGPPSGGRCRSALFVFGGLGKGAKSKSSSNKNIKPTFDKTSGRWVASPGDDGVYPYDAVGSLLRHGPSPFVQRVTDPAGYEQAVLAYMASENCNRSEATGNVDAKTNNAADWAYQRMEAKKDPSKKVDYTVLKAKDAALTAVWALGITPLVLSSIAQTVSQFGTGPSTIKH